MFDDLNQNNPSGSSQKSQNDQGNKNFDQKNNNQGAPSPSSHDQFEQPTFAQSDKKEPSLEEVLKQEKDKGVDLGGKNEKVEDMFSSVDGEDARLENRNKQNADNFSQAIKNANPNQQLKGSSGKNKSSGIAKKDIFVWLALLVLIIGVVTIGFFWISGILDNQKTVDLNKNQNGIEDSSQNQEQEVNENNDEQNNIDSEEESENQNNVYNEDNEGDDLIDINPDTDGDGLADEQERLIGTDIDNIDTDGDKLTDFEEFINYKTNPFKIDTDGDNLSDFEEIKKFKTDPLLEDTDGDTYLDGAEVENGYNPNGEGKL